MLKLGHDHFAIAFSSPSSLLGCWEGKDNGGLGSSRCGDVGSTAPGNISYNINAVLAKAYEYSSLSKI